MGATNAQLHIGRVRPLRGTRAPSEADADVTCRIKQAGEILGILHPAHIILNSTAYFSFLESGDF